MKYLLLGLLLSACTPQPAMPKNCRFMGQEQAWVCEGRTYTFTYLPHPSGSGRPAGRVLQTLDGHKLPILVDAQALPLCTNPTNTEAP